jgi:hypothetical protein
VFPLNCPTLNMHLVSGQRHSLQSAHGFDDCLPPYCSTCHPCSPTFASLSRQPSLAVLGAAPTGLPLVALLPGDHPLQRNASIPTGSPPTQPVIEHPSTQDAGHPVSRQAFLSALLPFPKAFPTAMPNMQATCRGKTKWHTPKSAVLAAAFLRQLKRAEAPGFRES